MDYIAIMKKRHEAFMRYLKVIQMKREAEHSRFLKECWEIQNGTRRILPVNGDDTTYDVQIR